MKLFHFHHFLPLISISVSYNTKDVLKECKCGKRIIKREYNEEAHEDLNVFHLRNKLSKLLPSTKPIN